MTGKKRGRPTNKEETLEQEVKRLRMENEVLKNTTSCFSKKCQSGSEV